MLPRDFPRYSSHLLLLKCYPYALLRPFNKDFYPFPDSSGMARPMKRQAQMGLVSIVSKKSVHSSAVIRVRIKMRIKEVLKLVIVRGAYADEAGTIQFNERDIGEKEWLLKGIIPCLTQITSFGLTLPAGWAYTLQPTLEVYRHPLEGLISELRKALKLLKEQGTKLELQWSFGLPSDVSNCAYDIAACPSFALESWCCRTFADRVKPNKTLRSPRSNT